MFQSRARERATPPSVKKALDFAIEVSDLIDKHHPNHVPVDMPQKAIATALFMQSLEHRQAIILLVYHGARSSAAALIRPAFEAYFRGVWALKVATSEQVRDIFGDHPRIPTLETVLKQLRRNDETRALGEYDSWKDSGDYVHSGPLQLCRWLSSGGIDQLHSDSDALDMLELSDFCGLMAAISMNEVCGQESPELAEKLTEHSLRRITRRVVEAYDSPVEISA